MGKLCVNCGTINDDSLTKCKACGDILPKIDTIKDKENKKTKHNNETLHWKNDDSKASGINKNDSYVQGDEGLIEYTENNSSIDNINFFIITGICIWFLGFIGGFILGFANKITVYNEFFEPIDERFNFSQMIYSWIGSFLLGSMFIFFGNVITYLEKIANKK